MLGMIDSSEGILLLTYLSRFGINVYEPQPHFFIDNVTI